MKKALLLFVSLFVFVAVGFAQTEGNVILISVDENIDMRAVVYNSKGEILEQVPMQAAFTDESAAGYHANNKAIVKLLDKYLAKGYELEGVMRASAGIHTRFFLIKKD
jgi:hypothetical protein